jgi:hypothetical protein
MTTIETIASVTADHRLVVDTSAPAEIAPGEHRVLVLVDPQAASATSRQPLKFSNYPVGPVSSDVTFSREQLYDDIR